MKLPLILSAITLVSAVRVPNTWPQQPNQNPNLNDVNRDGQQIRQDGQLAQQVPNYNGINPFINNLANLPPGGLIAQGNIFSNLPDYNNWFAGVAPNQGFGANLINNFNPLGQQQPNPPIQRNYNGNPSPYNQQRPNPGAQSPNGASRRDPSPYREVQGQVPFMTYTTQRSAPQSAPFNNLPPVHSQGQRTRVNQAFPQANPTTAPITELDFSPLDPFPHSQQDFQATNPNNMFDTTQMLNNFDPFSQHPQINGYPDTQPPQRNKAPFNKPLLSVTDNRYNPAVAAKTLNFNPFTQNYRDHRTHEPTFYDPNYDRDAVPTPKRLEHEKAPIVNNHEYPAEVPTRPIYPGEAQWSKPGAKHRPFVSKQQYKNLEESNEHPDGHDTFLEAQKLFEKQQQQFGLRSQQLSKENNSPPESSTKVNDESDIFVPTRLYAQVRHSEDEKHLPPQTDGNGRLKELVKDSKVQTIYSEEGYEDSAYDHAGHEKKAENTEGFESDEKNKEVKAKKKVPVKKYDRKSSSYAVGDQNLNEDTIEKLKKEDINKESDDEDSNEDSEPAGTHYDEQSYLNKLDSKDKDVENNIIKSKNIKIVTAKDKGGGKIEMEISSEVKAVRQPNNSTKIHKYVKIYPKLKESLTSMDKMSENEISTSYREKEVQLEADRRSLTVDPTEIFIEEIIDHTTNGGTTSEEIIFTTVTPTEYSEIVTMEIPITTQPTTSIPKLEDKDDESLENADTSDLNLNSKIRRKRSSDGIPEIEIDTDFIDKINHDLGKPTEKSKEPNENKYPYYNTYKLKGLHQDSPLRYAEDLKAVPKKTEGKLAFYDLADRKMACSDVNPEVDPVPDRIKNADESVEDDEEADEDNDPATKEARLGQLGDKIDCFKVKYFGENPLDNPIFQEELVGPVQPIFSEIETISKTKMEPAPNGKEPLNSAASSYNANNEIEEGKRHKYGLKSWFPGKGFGLGENTERDTKFVNHFVERNPNLKINAELLSQQSKSGNSDGEIKAQNSKESANEVLTPPTLITTPKYSIDLKPKHIYDQIQLLNYLPEEEFEEIKKAIEADLPKLNKTEMTTFMPNINKTEPVLSAPVAKKKKSGTKNAERRAKALKNSEESMRMETSDDGIPESLPEVDALQLIRKKPRKPLYQIFDVNKFIPKVPQIPPVSRNSNPNYYAPVSINPPTYQIFDINKYLPTTPFPLFKNFLARSTVLPKYKVFSEVFYKEDIKPNEQLNVFTDVLKHIDSFPKLKDSFSESSEPISVKLDTKKVAEKFPQSIFEETQTSNKDFFSSTVTTLMTTFDPKTYASNHRYPSTENPLSAQKQIEDMLNAYGSTKKPKRRRRIKTTTQETPVVIEESTSTLHYMGENADVMGLMPPIIQGYKTIYHPKRDNNEHISGPTIMIEEKKINKYYVQGMRPPPKQKVYLYSDFLTDNQIMQRISKPLRNKLRRRSKRDAQRPAYAEVTRNRNKTETAPETKKDEADDYVPHRPKNYHYDEKTGKIVYDKKPEEQNKEEEEVVEYIEVVEEPPKTTEKPKQSPVFATATPPPVGQSYTDFVKLLKSASNYHEIPDPTTTEKGAEPVTQKIITSTLPAVATKPPEFLSILAKVRSDSNYKAIEEKKKTTTPKPVEQVEEEAGEEESQVENIRNSPGGFDEYEARANWEIFDITDYLPNIKSYLPKTSIDTSKYKTIERPQVRHSLSSRYNSEEEQNLQNVNTNKRPILNQKETGQRRVQVTTSHPEAVPPRPTRLQRRRTTTPRSVQDDVTGASDDESEVQNDGTKKRRRRRRRKRIKVIPNAEEGQEGAPDSTKKVVRRRTERESHIYSEGNEQYEQTIEDLPDVPASSEDYVDFEIPANYNNKEDEEQPDNLSVVAEKFVDVFKNYDKDKKHGGNYKKEDEANKTIIIVAPEAPEIAKTEKPVVVFKAYDEQKKHGGNYKKEDEVNKTVTVVAPQVENKTKKPIEVFKDYDKSKKHGGNYKAEKDVAKAKEPVKPVTAKPDPKDIIKKVEEFKEYDKTKKHGGNYRPEPEKIAVSEHDESGLKKTASIQVANVNIFQDYDKTKKHGGYYKAEEEDIAKPKEEMKPIIIEADPKDIKNVEEFKEYDKTKKHGGNYRPEPEEISVSEQDESGLEKTASIQVANVNVFQDYDKTKKHGGNYKAELEDIVKEQVKPVDGEADPNSVKKVEVFKEYDKTKKHGGNYKAELEDIVKEQLKPVNGEADPKSIKKVDVFKEYDKTKKHGGNYKADKEDIVKEPVKPVNGEADHKDIMEVEEFKEYDKTKKHGGNYRPEQEEGSVSELDESGLLKTASIQIANVNIFQDYDKTKKHGGNYKPESESIDKPTNIELEKPKDVEVFKDYDESKKHGGNYKPESDVVVQEQQLEESQLGSQQVKQNALNDDSGKKESVEVFKDYDKTKKHGGNYMRENDTPEKEKESENQETDKAEDVEIFKKYDEQQKTGGNYKREEEFIEPKAEATYISKTQLPQTKRYVESRNDVQRLADVVLKPEAFYTDLKLPLDINALKVTRDLPNEELEEIVKSEEVDKEQILRRNDKAEDVVVIGSKVPKSLFQEPLTTTKKPLFIKDPSKRLYFYAPLS